MRSTHILMQIPFLSTTFLLFAILLLTFDYYLCAVLALAGRQTIQSLRTSLITEQAPQMFSSLKALTDAAHAWDTVISEVMSNFDVQERRFVTAPITLLLSDVDPSSQSILLACNTLLPTHHLSVNFGHESDAMRQHSPSVLSANIATGVEHAVRDVRSTLSWHANRYAHSRVSKIESRKRLLPSCLANASALSRSCGKASNLEWCLSWNSPHSVSSAISPVEFPARGIVFASTFSEEIEHKHARVAIRTLIDSS